jgi:xanthine dehydrogenase accessory factor
MSSIPIQDENSYRSAAGRLEQQGIVERTVRYAGGSFMQKLSRDPELVICGGGHVALALCETAQKIGFSVTVIDDRREFANADRFPGARRVICSGFGPALDALENKCAWYAVMTRGHEFDKICLDSILRFPFMYLGMIGSRTKIAYTRERLLSEGVTEVQLAELHAPIGLSIGAQTPQEIAVSIAAQLIQERAKLGCTYLAESVYRVFRTYSGRMTAATIIEKKGSAPRGVGSCMVVCDDGGICGTIGGGTVEAAVIREAAAVKEIAGEKAVPFTRVYELSPAGAADLGMVCGGSVTVLFEHIPADRT